MIFTGKLANQKRRKYNNKNETKHNNWKKKRRISMPCPIYYYKTKMRRVQCVLCVLSEINKYIVGLREKNGNIFADGKPVWTKWLAVFILWWLKHMMITTTNISSTRSPSINKYRFRLQFRFSCGLFHMENKCELCSVFTVRQFFVESKLACVNDTRSKKKIYAQNHLRLAR